MSGHSKWHKIKHRKAATDSDKSQRFMRLTRDIQIAARHGTDPAVNQGLREAIARARKANLPQANIDRLLQRAAQPLQSVTYEGYAAGGSALLVVTATANPRRTVVELRHLFQAHGGSLGEPGSVRWKFAPRVRLTTAPPPSPVPESVALQLIDAGATDLTTEAGLTITCPPDRAPAIEALLTRHGLTVQDTTTMYMAAQPSSPPPKTRSQVEALVAALATHADVTAVYTDLPPRP